MSDFGFFGPQNSSLFRLWLSWWFPCTLMGQMNQRRCMQMSFSPADGTLQCLGFSKKTTPFWVEEFFGKEHFVGSCGLAIIIHICFWLLSFCRDWNFARVQNIIFTKNNCSKVRRAHSFSANYPGPLKRSNSELKQLKIPTVGSDEIC